MTIPPIGPIPGQPVPKDDRFNKKDEGEVRAEPKASRADSSARAADEVKISPEVKIIHARQEEISRLQVAEKASDEIENKLREIEREIKEQNESGRAGDTDGRIEK